MKLKQIAVVVLMFMMVNIINLPVSAIDFSDGLPSGWTEKTVGDASATSEDGALTIRVNGTHSTAASSVVTTEYKDVGSSLYFSLNFAVNDAAVDRGLYLTDGTNEARLAVINGSEIMFINGYTANIEVDNYTVLKVGIDKQDMLMSVYLNDELIINEILDTDAYSAIDLIDFSNTAVKFSTQIVLENSTSVFTITDFEMLKLDTVNIFSVPANDKTALEKAETGRFEISFGTVMNFGGIQIVLYDNTSEADIAYAMEETSSDIIIIPDSELEYGHNYTLNISGVRDFHNRDNYNFTHSFIVAEEGYEAPVVELTEPNSGAQYYTGDRVAIRASASSAWFSELVLYINGELTTRTTDTVLDISYRFADPGEQTILVRAFDTYGGYSEKSASVNITVDNPPNLRIEQPIQGTAYNLGDTITVRAAADDSESTVNRVEFRYDGELIETITEPPYICSLTADSVGTHTISAAAYDEREQSTEASVSVTVNKSDKVYVFKNNFDSYSGGSAPENFGGVSTENGGTYESGINTQNGTNCFKISMGDVTTGGGPFIYIATSAGGKAGVEGDIFIPGTGSPTAAFSLRTQSATINDVTFSGGSLRLKNGTNTENFSVERDMWHHFVYEFDTYMNTYSFWLNGELVAYEYDSDASSMIGTLSQIRITFNGSNSYVMLDDFEFYRLLTAPFITDVGYEAEDGSTVISDFVPYDADTIHIIMNTKLDAETVNKNTITYIDEDGIEKSFESVRLSDDGMYIIAKTANGFLSMTSYRIKMTKDVASENGVYVGADSFGSFNVSNKPYDVKNCKIYVNGREATNSVLKKGDILSVRATVSNEGDVKDEAVIIVALCRDNRTVAINSFTKSIASGDNMIATGQITCPEDGLSPAVYVWDSWQNRVPVSHKIFK